MNIEDMVAWFVSVANDSPAPVRYTLLSVMNGCVHTVASWRADVVSSPEKMKAYVLAAAEPVYPGHYQFCLEGVYADGAKRLFAFTVSYLN